MILFSAFSEKYIGGRPMAMAGAFVPVANDLNSVYYNPAGLASITGFALGGGYLRYYNMEEMQDVTFSAAYPTDFGAFGASYHSYGFDLYKETQMIFTHGFVLLRRIQIGYNLKYMKLALSPDPAVTPTIEYGSDSLITVDVGCMMEIDRNLSAGAYAMNVTSPKIGNNNAEEAEQKFTMGVAYKPSAGLTTSLCFDKAIEDEYQLRAGAEMWMVKYFAIRGGVQSRPFNFTFGAGFNLKNFYLDYALVNNNVLGETHVLSFSMMFGKGLKRTVFIGKRKKRSISAQKPAEVYYTGPKININTATAEELTELPRVGPKTAQRIVDDRIQNGSFKSIGDITRVKGIGPKTFQKFRHMITTGEDETQKKLETTGFNINSAQMKAFVNKGISPISAAKIIKYREEKGGINDIDELNTIPGVKKKDILKIKELIKQNPESE